MEFGHGQGKDAHPHAYRAGASRGPSALSLRPARPRSPSLRRRRCTGSRCRASCRGSAAHGAASSTMRAPVAPIGWPSAAGTAVHVDLGVIQAQVLHGRHGDHRERLVDLVQIDVLRAAIRSASSSFCIAPTGASVNHSGSRAKLVYPRMRARGFEARARGPPIRASAPRPLRRRKCSPSSRR